MALLNHCPSCHAALPEGSEEGTLCETCAQTASIENIPTLLGDLAEPDDQAASASARTAAPLQRIGDYEVLGKLGQGGMGAVYRARQLHLERVVALKILPADLEDDENFVARFQREAAVASGLNHPNLVHVYASGVSDGCHFIAMELVEGENLRQRMKRGRLPQGESLRICLEVARALQFAWQHAQLIHRDVKPSNIYLSEAGAVKLGDLGLAKSLLTNTTGLTHTGAAIGTPHYISPEQAKGEKTIDLRADIYSLGCTLYELLAGSTPYHGTDPLGVMSQHIHSPPPAILKVLPQCPVPLARVVNKMLRKARHERHQNYEELIGALEKAIEHLEQAPVVTQGVSPVLAAWREIGAAEERGLVARGAAAPHGRTPLDALPPSPGMVAKPKLGLWLGMAAGVVILVVGGFLLTRPAAPKTAPAPRVVKAGVSSAPAAVNSSATPAPAVLAAPLPPVVVDFLPAGQPGLVKTFDLELLGGAIFVDDDRHALLAEKPNSMQLLDLASGRALWRAEKDYVESAVVVMPDGIRAVRFGFGFGHKGVGVVLMNVATGEDLARWSTEDNSLFAGASFHIAGSLSPSGSYLALGFMSVNEGSGLHTVCVLNTASMKLIAEWHGLPLMRKLPWIDDDRFMASAEGNFLTFDRRRPDESAASRKSPLGTGIEADLSRQFLAGPTPAHNFGLTDLSHDDRTILLKGDLDPRQVQFVAPNFVAALAGNGHEVYLANVITGEMITDLHPEQTLGTLDVCKEAAFALARTTGDPMALGGKKDQLSLTLWRLRPTVHTAAPGAASLTGAPPAAAPKDTPFTNSLGMKVVPIDPSPGSEPWQDVLRDPAQLVIDRGAKRTPDGLLFTEWGSATRGPGQAPQRDGAVRMVTTLGPSPMTVYARNYRLSVDIEKQWLLLGTYDTDTTKFTTVHVFPVKEPLRAGQEYELELRVVGETLTAKLNGETLGITKDTTQQQGDFGVRGGNGKTLPLLVKRLEILDLDAPAGTGVSATKDAPFLNSLGMKFVPVPITGGPTGGQRVLFSVWDTRVQDYEGFAKEQTLPQEASPSPTHPVVHVSWEDAVKFCAWLTEREHRAGQLPAGWKYRLPSDHEWSCAVGIGEQEAAEKTPAEKAGKVPGYPWGPTFPPPRGFANYDPKLAVDDYETTSPVGAFPANAYGLYDLSGNVWQWCEDWWDKAHDRRVLRGCSFENSKEITLRASVRGNPPATLRSEDLGFRCVLIGHGG